MFTHKYVPTCVNLTTFPKETHILYQHKLQYWGIKRNKNFINTYMNCVNHIQLKCTRCFNENRLNCNCLLNTWLPKKQMGYVCNTQTYINTLQILHKNKNRSKKYWELTRIHSQKTHKTRNKGNNHSQPEGQNTQIWTKSHKKLAKICPKCALYEDIAYSLHK